MAAARGRLHSPRTAAMATVSHSTMVQMSADPAPSTEARWVGLQWRVESIREWGLSPGMPSEVGGECHPERNGIHRMEVDVLISAIDRPDRFTRQP